MKDIGRGLETLSFFNLHRPLTLVMYTLGEAAPPRREVSFIPTYVIKTCVINYISTLMRDNAVDKKFIPSK